VSSVAPSGVLRGAIGVMLLLSALKLLGVANWALAVSGAMAAMVVVTVATVRSRTRARRGAASPHTLATADGPA